MDNKDKKYENDAEKLIKAALGANVFEREEGAEAARVVRKWEDQPALVKKNIAGSLEDRTKKVKKVEARKLKKIKKAEKGNLVENARTPLAARGVLGREAGEQEKEKTAVEVLDTARVEFARMDLIAERYLQAEKKLKRKKTKADFEKDGGYGGEEYAKAKEKYFEALRARRAEMSSFGSEKDIIIETITGEANKLYDKKMELSLGLRGGASNFEKVLNVSKKVVEKYRKMPLKYKLWLSAGLFAGGVVAGAVGGAAGAAMVTGVVAGKWFQRVLGGSATAVGLEGLVKRSQEKKAEKEVSAEFADKLIESIKNEDKKLDEKLLKLESGKKWEKYRRFALAGSMGVLIASGWTAKALGNVIPHEWADWAKEKMGLENQGTAPEAKISAGVGEVASVETSSGFIEVAEKGDSVWKMVEEQFDKHYGGLEGARKIYAIDAIKDKIAADPGKFGLDDIDKIKVGQKIDFSSIFKDKAGMDKIFRNANALKQAALDNIKLFKKI